MTSSRAPADALTDALLLAAAPALVMLLLSLFALSVRVPDVVVSALQHLAAGIVLSAVAVELVPGIMAAPSDAMTTAGMTIGFVAGIGMFLVLGKFCSHDDEVEDEDEEYTYRRDSVDSIGPSFSTPDRNASKRQLARTHSHDERNGNAPSFPFVLTVAVCIDALVDGLLIGISSASGAEAGVVITAALSIEMGFLGLTFASSLKRQPRARRFLAVLLPPCLLIAGGGLGGLLGSLVAASPPAHSALLAFGIAALLYLVTEELLLEAHSSQEEKHVWYVDIMFFVGFYLSFLLEKFAKPVLA